MILTVQRLFCVNVKVHSWHYSLYGWFIFLLNQFWFFKGNFSLWLNIYPSFFKLLVCIWNNVMNIYFLRKQFSWSIQTFHLFVLSYLIQVCLIFPFPLFKRIKKILQIVCLLVINAINAYIFNSCVASCFIYFENKLQFWMANLNFDVLILSIQKFFDNEIISLQNFMHS